MNLLSVETMKFQILFKITFKTLISQKEPMLILGTLILTLCYSKNYYLAVNTLQATMSTFFEEVCPVCTEVH